MRAIVMTYDRNHPYTEHMISQYEKMWPDNPFVFRVPFQRHKIEETAKVEPIQTPNDITSTVLALIRDLPDDEWVYWAIDDKYPIKINVKEVRKITAWVPSITDPAISGVSFCRVRDLKSGAVNEECKLRGDSGRVLIERINYQQIWVHQFLRVKVLRWLFESMPAAVIDTEGAKSMDRLKMMVAKPGDHRLFVTEKNYVAFGESTSAGKVTDNCCKSMMANGIQLPADAEFLSKSITMGMETFRKPSLSRFLGLRR